MSEVPFRTKEDFITYVRSEDFNVSTRPDRAVAYSGADPDGVENWKLADIASGGSNSRGSADYDKLEKTPGGSFLHENLRDSGLSKMDQKEIWQAASRRYISEASGNLTCYVQNAREDSVFRQTELPESLVNEKITSINGISKEDLGKEYIGDLNLGQRGYEDHIFDKLSDGLKDRHLDSFNSTERRDLAKLDDISGKKHEMADSGKGELKDKVAIAGEDFARLYDKDTESFTLVKWQKGMEKHRGEELSVEKDSFETSKKDNARQLDRDF